MKIIITGATGLLGSRLAKRLIAEGQSVIAVTRTANKAKDLGVEVVEWRHPEMELFPQKVLEGADVVVHLAGEHIATSRWTDEQKKKIRDSRILSTRQLVASLQNASQPPKALICASATGFYGDRGNENLSDESSAGTGFLAEVCRDWEAEANRVTDFGLRAAQVRIGIVLAKEGGALKEILPMFQVGLGASLGDGQQWFPWIHLDDVAGIFAHAISHTEISGPINATAPEPVTNEEFTKTLAEVLHRFALFSAPEFLLRLGLGEMSGMLLGSTKALPDKAQQTGYQFQFPALKKALQDLLKS